MNKKIDEYLNFIGSMLIDKLSYENIYKELIGYGNRYDDINNILDIFDKIDDNYKKYLRINDNEIIISNELDMDNSKKRIELSIFNKYDYVSDNVNKIMKYLIKKKIKFSGLLKIENKTIRLSITLNDIDDGLSLIDYINCKLSKNIDSVNPLFFTNGNVMVSLNEDYSYIEILSRYLYKFMLEMREVKKEINYNNFKVFMLDNYFKIDNQIEMDKYLYLNTRDIKLSSFYNNLEEITNIILYLFNGNDYEEFRDYVRKLNRKNRKNKYDGYDEYDNCKPIFEELVKTMYTSYGDNDARNNIINYIKTGDSTCITRKNNLRKKITTNPLFRIYLSKISIEIDMDKIIDKCKFDEKKRILEDICKETFLSVMDNDGKNVGKIQVARGLIRMEYGDYSAITRNNDARKMAVLNIKPDDVKKLIMDSLGIEYVRKDEEMYELYALYIEKLCIS